MKEHQSQNYGEYVRKEKLKNLLTAHRRLAETGGIKEVILLSKFILKLSNKFKLHNFCGFDVAPDASKFTRFKQDFIVDLQSMFDQLIDLTEPICQAIDSSLADMTLSDTSDTEAWVPENNPKYANRIIKQLKAFKKAKHLDDC